MFDKALRNDESKLRALIDGLKGHGTLLFVVDQPATIGALPIAVAHDAGVLVGYLPGLAVRRIADLHAGEAKTDARDAAIIAEATRTLPHALRSIQLADEQVAELSMLSGFDDDLAGQVTATTTASGACSPRSIQHSNESLVRTSITRRSLISCNAIPLQRTSRSWDLRVSTTGS